MIDCRPTRPLDPDAVKAANEQIWKTFPELKGRQLTMNGDDYKYRKAWMEAYSGTVEKKTCPKKSISASSVVGCSTPSPATPLSKQEWQKKSLQAAGIDRSTWQPDKGFEDNRNTVKKVYDYYAHLYDQNPNLRWAGMAKLAGGTVYGGLEDGLTKKALASKISYLPPPAGSLGQTAADEAQFVENTIVGMQQDIFLDLAWQHQAYLERGICELDAAYRRGDISQSTYEAWLDIDSGDNKRIWQGNKTLLHREQFDILDSSYKAIRNRPLGGLDERFMSRVAQSPIPGGKPFTEVVPGGDITNFVDRWKWIDKDMLPAYQQLTPADRTTLINEPLDDLAARKFAAGAK